MVAGAGGLLLVLCIGVAVFFVCKNRGDDTNDTALSNTNNTQMTPTATSGTFLSYIRLYFNNLAFFLFVFSTRQYLRCEWQQFRFVFVQTALAFIVTNVCFPRNVPNARRRRKHRVSIGSHGPVERINLSRFVRHPAKLSRILRRSITFFIDNFKFN